MINYEYLLRFDAIPKMEATRYGSIKSDYSDPGLGRESLTRMAINQNFYKIFVFDDYKDEKGNSLKVYAPNVLFKKVQFMVKELVDPERGCRYKYSLWDKIDEEKSNGFSCPSNRRHYRDIYNMWWDYKDDFFFFFEGADTVLKDMEYIREKIKIQMQMPTSAALKKTYLAELTRKNHKYRRTTISTCVYDKLTKTYYIEFLDDANLDEVFMDAILIVKASGHMVEVLKDGISHTITPDSVTDIIVSENGVDMVDSNTYFKRIEALVAQHKNVLNESRIKPVQVLKYIRDNKEVK